MNAAYFAAKKTKIAVDMPKVNDVTVNSTPVTHAIQVVICRKLEIIAPLPSEFVDCLD